MVRSVAARGKLALAFWMLFAHESGNATGSVSRITSGMESGSCLGSADGSTDDVILGSGNRAFDVGASPLF